MVFKMFIDISKVKIGKPRKPDGVSWFKLNNVTNSTPFSMSSAKYVISGIIKSVL